MPECICRQARPRDGRGDGAAGGGSATGHGRKRRPRAQERERVGRNLHTFIQRQAPATRGRGAQPQGRCGPLAMDEEHLMIAARYVAPNPVRARLATQAWDWPHSSVRAHLEGRDDGLVDVRPLVARASRFADLLDPGAFTPPRRGERIGRPLGGRRLVAAISQQLERSVTLASADQSQRRRR